MLQHRVHVVEDEGVTAGLTCAASRGGGFASHVAANAAEVRRKVGGFDLEQT